MNRSILAAALTAVCFVPAHAQAKPIPGHVPRPAWIPTYSVQYDSQVRMGVSVGFIRGSVSDTLGVSGPNAHGVVARDGARVSVGYARAMLIAPNSLPPFFGASARFALSHGWGERGRQELGGLRVGPELELVICGLKLQAGLGRHVGGRRGVARSFSWAVGLGF